MDPGGRSRPDGAEPDDGAAISVRGIVKRFGDLVAVDHIDLSVEKGTVFGLLGPNGAGKTTLIRMLTTILGPDEGSASVAGYDVAAHPQLVRETIGLAGQFAAVDERLTGRENLRMVGRLTHLPKSVVEDRAEDLLVRFDLADAGDRTAGTYSGGMRRRLDLAAALVHRPPVLFLDEPTTGLDPQSRQDLWAIIAELVRDGTTVLLTTQYLEEADRLANRIAVISRGQKVAEGTAAELKASFGTTIVELGFADRDLAARAEAVLVGIGSVEVQSDPSALHLSVNDGGRAVLQVSKALDGADLDPVTFGVREPTLDDVFLSLTGHTAEFEVIDRDTADPAPVPSGAPGDGRS
jgi:ABC-2 type transport system ATP-binding protein